MTEPAPRRNSLLYLMIVLAVVAGGLAVWGVVSWTGARDDWTAANDAWVRDTSDLVRAESNDSLTFAKARDEAMKVARDEIALFHTIDYRKVDQDLDAWEKASTGALHDDVVGRRANSKTAIENARSITSGKVLSAAFTELDAREGRGTMIAAMNVTVTLDGKPAEQKYLRAKATVQRTDGGWKLSGLDQVDFARPN